MKKIILPSVILLSVVLNACQPQAVTDETANLKKVLTSYFEGIGTKDLGKMKALTTSNFMLFEDGKIWNNDSLVSIINKMKIQRIEYAFDNFRINANDKIGNMTYTNTGVFALNDTTKMTMHWIESATFVKEGDEWKIDFLHSSVKK